MIRNVIFLIVLGALVWSGISPKDRFTWFLEVAPVLLGAPLVFWTDRKYKITTLLLVLLGLHAIILCVGGHYTYAEVPLGEWLKSWGGFSRNHYDRIGHFAQGFVPAMIFREWLIRSRAIPSNNLRVLVSISFCLSFSAIYEFIEWFTALATGDNATAFLGTQGDVWDTQWDMFMALVGAIAAHIFFSRIHDAEIHKTREKS